MEGIYYVDDSYHDLKYKVNKIPADVGFKIDYSNKTDRIMHKVIILILLPKV